MQATVKPCLKCPEGTAAGMPIALNMQAPGRGHDQRINYVLNEGDVRVFHYTLGQAIPDVEMKYGRPVVHEDGSFEFPVLEGVGDAVGEPEELYGYERDGENRRLFRPMWPDCMERAVGVFVHAGSISGGRQMQSLPGRALHQTSHRGPVPGLLCPSRQP